jgi:hypothetical protein
MVYVNFSPRQDAQKRAFFGDLCARLSGMDNQFDDRSALPRRFSAFCAIINRLPQQFKIWLWGAPRSVQQHLVSR